jgi:tetratricopeptide (TPR) repeat protein
VGNIQVKAKRYDEAIAAYSRGPRPEHRGILSASPSPTSQCRLADAEAGFERARQLDPRNSKVLFQLAEIWMRQGQLDKAEAALKEALTRNVDVPRFSLKLGECYYQMKRYDQAEGSVRAALQKKPDLKTAHSPCSLIHEGGAIRARRRKCGPSWTSSRPTGPASTLANSSWGGRLQGGSAFSTAVATDFATGCNLAKALLDMGDLQGAQTPKRGWQAQGGRSRSRGPLPPRDMHAARCWDWRARRGARKLERGG